MPKEFNPTRSELRQLFRTLNGGLKGLTPEALGPHTPCPDSWVLASYVTGRLDEKTQQTVNAHLAFCDACFDDYAVLAGPAKIASVFVEEDPFEPGWYKSEKFMPAKWPRLQEVLSHWQHTIVDMGKIYEASGYVNGCIELVAEKPTFSATRWESALYELLARGLLDEALVGGRAQNLSKSFEVFWDQNLYRVEISVLLDETASFDISSVCADSQTLLHVALWRAKDAKNLESVFVSEPDGSGNVHFGATHAIQPDGEIFALTLFSQRPRTVDAVLHSLGRFPCGRGESDCKDHCRFLARAGNRAFGASGEGD